MHCTLTRSLDTHLHTLPTLARVPVDGISAHLIIRRPETVHVNVTVHVELGQEFFGQRLVVMGGYVAECVLEREL